MSLTILAVLTDADCAGVSLDAALAAAAIDPSATIRALHIEVDPDRIVAASEEIEMQRLRDAQEGDAGDRAAAIRAAFDCWSASHAGTSVTYERVVGRVEETLRAKAEGVDLLVLCRASNMDGGDALHAAAFEIDRPLVVVPPDWVGASFGHVLVAWSGSDASRRAMDAAMPWLSHAAAVTVLRIDGAGGTDDQLHDDIGLGGVAFTPVDRTRDEAVTIGAQIAREAEAAGADLIVAGAYRHAALVEWLTGSTTRHLIAAATRPLLMVH